MSSMVIIFIIALLAAILIDVVIIRRIAKKNRSRVASPQDVQILGRYSPVLTRIRAYGKSIHDKGPITLPLIINWTKATEIPKTETQNRSIAWIAIEIAIVLNWGLFLTFPFLNMNPMVIPWGREYPSHIQSHHLWIRFQQCGLCAMWNGSIQGGSPSFADAHGSMLHPLVIITTLAAGVSNGAKLAIVGAFLLAGLAQWWLGWILGLGRVARVWSSMIATAGGNLASRLEVGMFGGIIAGAYVILVIAAIILNGQET